MDHRKSSYQVNCKKSAFQLKHTQLYFLLAKQPGLGQLQNAEFHQGGRLPMARYHSAIPTLRCLSELTMAPDGLQEAMDFILNCFSEVS